MSKRGARLALYEMMGSRAARRTPLREAPPDAGPERANEPASVDLDHGGGWMSPGRVMQFPVGYAFVAIAGVVALLIVAYIVGYQRGETHMQAEMEGLLIRQPSGSATNGGGSRDPLNESSRPAVGSGENAANGPLGMPNSPVPRLEPGPIFSDPRQVGLVYFTIATTQRGGAERLAEFCRANGLETYAVPDKNGRFRVIAWPGFEHSERASQAVSDLKSTILRVGRLWKNDGGLVDLSDFYPERFDG